MKGEKAPRPRETVESDGGGGGDDGGVDAADRTGTPSPVESSPPASAGGDKAAVADVNAESPLLGIVALAAAMRGALPPLDGEADGPPVLLAPDGVDMGDLAEAYGAALGQALMTSGLGLDPGAVVTGMLSAAANEDSPMSVQMYEHQMNLLTASNAQANAAFHRSEADRFFSEAQDDHSIVALHPGRLLMEAEEPHPDDGVVDSPAPPAADAEKDAPPVGTPPGVRGGDEGGAPQRRRSRPPPRRSATAGATAVVLLQGRLLDGRLFYTPPPAPPLAPASAGGEAPPPPPPAAADMVLPLAVTLDPAVTPECLVTALTGMRIGGERTVYVHPDSGAGVGEFFGVSIPPGVCLVFDLELMGIEEAEA